MAEFQDGLGQKRAFLFLSLKHIEPPQLSDANKQGGGSRGQNPASAFVLLSSFTDLKHINTI
jgi:hypothetical protein